MCHSASGLGLLCSPAFFLSCLSPILEGQNDDLIDEGGESCFVILEDRLNNGKKCGSQVVPRYFLVIRFLQTSQMKSEVSSLSSSIYFAEHFLLLQVCIQRP